MLPGNLWVVSPSALLEAILRETSLFAHSFDSEAGFLVQPNKLKLIRPSQLGENDNVNVTWYENGTLAKRSRRAFGQDSDSLHDFHPCTVYDSVINARTVENSALSFQANSRAHSFDSEAGFLVQPNKLKLIRPSQLGENDNVNVTWYENGTLAKRSRRAFGQDSDSLHDFHPCTVYDSVINARTVENSALSFQANSRDVRKPRTPKLTFTEDHMLLVDWTSDSICKPVNYSVRLDEHSGSVRTHIIPGQVTKAQFTNVVGCNAMDICVTAVHSPLINETTCVLGWRPKKSKYDQELSIFWLTESLQPDSRNLNT
ncbi:hypothetical protein AHF37_00919 [Paragonimus kellicotti]|nr:hypothetical protein AHF37_00919 [Paragonimus kellicotti]